MHIAAGVEWHQPGSYRAVFEQSHYAGDAQIALLHVHTHVGVTAGRMRRAGVQPQDVQYLMAVDVQMHNRTGPCVFATNRRWQYIAQQLARVGKNVVGVRGNERTLVSSG